MLRYLLCSMPRKPNSEIGKACFDCKIHRGLPSYVGFHRLWVNLWGAILKPRTQCFVPSIRRFVQRVVPLAIRVVHIQALRMDRSNGMRVL